MDQDIPIVSTTEIGVDSGLRFTVENFFLCNVLPVIRGELSLCSVFTQALATHWDSTKTSKNTMLIILAFWYRLFWRIRIRCSCIFSDRRICRDSVGHDLTLLLRRFSSWYVTDRDGKQLALLWSGGHMFGRFGRRDIDWKTLVTDPIAWRVNFRQSSSA